MQFARYVTERKRNGTETVNSVARPCNANGTGTFPCRLLYQDLVDAGEANGFVMEVITLEVGSRGFLNLQGFMALIPILARTTHRVTCNSIKTIIMQSGYS